MTSPSARGGLALIAANDTELLYWPGSFFDFGFAKHKGLATYHVPPKLSVQKHDGGLRVSWPGPAWRYWLEHADSLEPDLWTLGPRPQDGPDSSRHVDFTNSENVRFFRLRRIPDLR